MMFCRLCALALLWGASGTRLHLRSENTTTSAVLTEGQQIAALREKLVKISAGLSKIADPNGPLAKTELGTEMAEFSARVKSVVNGTAGKSDDKSLKQLKEVMGSVTGLVKDLNSQQMRLMQEGEDQQNSLLLGVLMTKKGDAMDRQLEVLKAPDFANLAVTKEILAKKDVKTPLFQQVANFLDAHGRAEKKARGSRPAAPSLKGAAVAQIVTSLRARLAHLETAARHSEEAHANATQSVQALEKTKNEHEAKILRSIEKREDRKYQKSMAIRRQDISTMKAAIGAVEKGDMAGLQRAEAALESSIKSMRARNSGFLVLIQEGLRESGLDCPYCAAQCVDKCHNAGKSYTDCLAACQDAGK